MSKEEEKKFEVDFKNLKTLDIKKSKGKFKTFTNGSIINGTEFQPYLGKPLILNTDKILSVYPSEDDIGTSIHAENNQNTWKVLEDIDTVIKRLNE
jgi:chaperonin GroEL (HSP60 family)